MKDFDESDLTALFRKAAITSAVNLKTEEGHSNVQVNDSLLGCYKIDLDASLTYIIQSIKDSGKNNINKNERDQLQKDLKKSQSICITLCKNEFILSSKDGEERFACEMRECEGKTYLHVQWGGKCIFLLEHVYHNQYRFVSPNNILSEFIWKKCK